MINNEQIIQIIFNVIDTFNENQKNENRLKKSKETVLFGHGTVLDSLGLVDILIGIEQEIEDEYGINITIADERAMSQEQSPFKTIGTLIDYIELLEPQL
tara:strand:- start:319 stop:618 length:300 start_codon:yes stop_codon:yes gene_type:complete